jgi:transposase InsO family protein
MKQALFMAGVAQLVRAPVCGTGGRGFNSHHSPHRDKESVKNIVVRSHQQEFVARALDLWSYSNGIILAFSRPGKLTDNAYIESFNSRFRQECLNKHCFLSLEDSKVKIEAWR